MTAIPAAHSPAPWIGRHGHRTQVVRGIYDADGRPVVLFHGIARAGSERGAANAHLIAAAPELLDALETFVAEYVALVESGDAGFWDAELEPKVIAARAAISKAKGYTPTREA